MKTENRIQPGPAKSENRIQQEIYVWFWNTRVEERGLLFHVNNSAASRIQGARLRSMGMVRGVADMVYLKPGGAPILIEVKTEVGRQSPQQREWEQAVTRAGYRYEVVRSLTEFQQLCK